MAGAGEITIRTATAEDAGAIAALHADSWRHSYRGAYSDEFLDGDVLEDRKAVWSARLDRTGGTTATFVAETPSRTDTTRTDRTDRTDRTGLAGFAHIAFDADPEWGTLLDNLHVAHDLKRTGLGTRLIAITAEHALAHHQLLHLYVLEQNTNAQAFYRARGGRYVESSFVSPPGGIASRLSGTPKRQLYVWDEPSTLLGYS